jgi:PAS domain-containing protein
VEALYASRKAQAQLSSVINHANVTLWAVDAHGIITVAEGPGLKQLRLTTSGDSPEGSANASQSQTTESTQTSQLSDARSRGSSVSQAFPRDVAPRVRSPTMIGRSIYEIWEGGTREHVARALRGEHVTKEMEVGGRWFRTSYTPMREREMYRATQDVMTEAGGVITGVVGASLDITQNKRAQRMMEESAREKMRALSAETAAKEASRLKSEFLANMSHEIRYVHRDFYGETTLKCLFAEHLSLV